LLPFAEPFEVISRGSRVFPNLSGFLDQFRESDEQSSADDARDRCDERGGTKHEGKGEG
jgi:hypothetical protein